MTKDQVKPNTIIRGPVFPELVQILVVVPMGESIKIIGRGLSSNKVHEAVLDDDQLAILECQPEKEPFDGNSQKFRLGIEALRLGWAYEYDPYFSLSIARVDPLPHQLEAVYDYFLKLPRIRFLLADDPGAGKTIMAGLLIKELKVRGLIKRILIVTPANLSFQWQREMKDKFREPFEVINSQILRANYGSNPWQERHQVITSISWVSRIDDAKISLLRSHWDLIIVDEAHKMSAYNADKKTLAYQLGEALSQMTDHFLLMTATPHKGDPENFRLFLELLDRDVYGDIQSLQEAMDSHEAPFYLRRIKEALVHFPDPETGTIRTLFTKRWVSTSEFQITAEEMDFYDALTHYVEDQSIKAAQDDSSRGRALGFTMAMLQRRFASSMFAVRRSLERMRDKREKILADPEGHRQNQIQNKLPEDFDELPEDEQDEILTQLEEVVASIDPDDLREEILQLSRLIKYALEIEGKEIESKLAKLREVITKQGIFADPKMKLLIFTEHKDTLDYLVGKLRDWGLSVTKIHGGMKIGNRDMVDSRIYAEREFRESCKVLVATEAAGEGINLQFCWFMINYDIPWNPVRLEQRMGRIHRYGQEKDCLIFNFVSTNTREGRVMNKLFERIRSIEDDLDPRHTGKIFNVLGDVFPSNQLEKMLRDMYARNLTEEIIKNRIVQEIDADRFRQITASTLEGLAKKELNLSAIVGKSAEARERRLVPEVIEDFFLTAGPLSGVQAKEISKGKHLYKIGKVPKTLWALGEKLEPRFGSLGRDYKHIVFDKKRLTDDPTLEWVTPGHPLFEVIREDMLSQTQTDLLRGAVFYDLHRTEPARLDVLSASVKDGCGNVIHQRLFVMECDMKGVIFVRQPTLFLDLIPANSCAKAPDDSGLPDRPKIEQTLHEQALKAFQQEMSEQREKEIKIISKHLEISLNVLIDRQNNRMAELHALKDAGDTSPQLLGHIKQTEDRIDELNARLEGRREELDKERVCMISDIKFHGRAWVLPHPERTSPGLAPMVRDEEVEKIAIQAVIAYEKNRGWEAESVETQNRGFDLISRRPLPCGDPQGNVSGGPNPEDPKTALDIRFIEVKGRAGVGDIALTANEYKTADRLKKDYWLYVVYNCAGDPEIHTVQNPIELVWEPIVKVEHYRIKKNSIYGKLK